MLSPVKIWRRQKKIRSLLGKKGKVVTWTRIFVAGEEFKKYVPYIVAMVEFADGERAMGQLVDVDVQKDIKPGLRVQSILRKVREVESDDVIAYGIKFKAL
jgi:uncharacterized OB-fold protein